MSYLGLHLASPVNNWNLEVQRAYRAGSPYAVIKTLHPENYREVQEAAPGTPYVYRHWDDRLQKEVILPMIYRGQYTEAADLWISQSKDSINQHMGTTPGRPVYFESMNEEYPSNNTAKLRAVVQFDIAFCQRLSLHCPGVRPAVFTAAIGNPDHGEVAELLPLARACASKKGLMCYHMYHSVYYGRSFVNSYPHQRDLHMRWAYSFDEYFRQNGVYVNWMLSEAGAIGSEESGYGPKPLDGWKLDRVWNNNIDNYINDLRALDSLVASSIPAKEGRVVGLTIFTTEPNPSDWIHFNIKDGDLYKLTDYVISNPTPTPTPPPVPVERVMGLDISRWQGTMNFQTAYNRGARFVFIKATEGVSWIDPRYFENAAGAAANNILDGPYHFYLSDEDPIQQKNHFLSVTGVTTTLPHVLDVEDPPGITFGEVSVDGEEVGGFLGPLAYENYSEILELADSEAAYLGDDVRQCAEAIMAEIGRRPILYTNKFFYDAYLTNANLGEVADLFIAQWTTAQNPTIPSDWSSWTFWQYSNSGIGSEWGAQSARVDLDYFNGNIQALLAYASSIPVPPPEPDNLLRNWSFEEGHYIQYPQYNNILVPNEWKFYFAASTVQNPYSPDPVNRFLQPELMPLNKYIQLPPSEWDDFVWHGDFTLKLFARERAWQSNLVQPLGAPVKRGRLVINIFPDCYTAIVNGQKVWGTDPNTCLIVPAINQREYGNRIQVAPGRRHTIEFDIALDEEEIWQVGVKIIAPFATLNNGVFVDALEFIELPEQEPFPIYASTISLLPPTYTPDEEQIILAHVRTNRETMAYSQHDCVKVTESGLPGTVRVWWANRWSINIVSWLQSYGVENIQLYPV